jgi:MAF protein
MPLILASSSPFRKILLAKLGLVFSTHSPDIDETPQPNETPKELTWRLSQEKAQEIAKTHQGLIIASDQVATLQGEILTKPHTHKNAVNQLSKSSGKRVRFLTGLSLLNTQTQKIQTIVEEFSVVFRSLSPQQIESYLQKERPYRCAGSFKSEGLGIVLFEKLEGDDPNALVGLPLIALTTMLKNEGISPL